MARRDRLVLAAWEAGAGADPAIRPAALLAALENIAVAQARQWPIGERDAALVEWRARLFGRDVTAVAHCPACSTGLEFHFVPEGGAGGGASIESEGKTLALAGPSTDDLIAALASTDPAQTLRAATLRGVPEGAHAAALDALAAAYAAAGEIELVCIDCSYRWALTFDIGALLWRELAATAARLMREVATLARAFGWSERTVLALGRTRRNAYLALAET